MNRILASLLLILLIQCMLVATVYWPGANTPETDLEPMAGFDSSSVDQLQVGDEFDNETVLQRVGSRWILPELEGLPADTAMVEALLDAITTGSSSAWPIADSIAARQRFRVASYYYRRKIDLFQGDATLGKFYLGTSPGFRRVYARNNQQDAIYSIPFSAHDAPGHAGKWLDRKLLQTRAPVSIAADSYSLLREGDHWLSGMGQVPEERELEALLDALRSLQIDGLASGDDQRDLAEAEADLIFNIESLAGEVTLELFRTGEKYFIHSSEYPLFFSLSAYDYDRLATIDAELISGTSP